MENELSHSSALMLERTLEEVGIRYNREILSSCDGHLYRLVLGSGPRLLGAVKSTQLKIDVKPKEQRGQYERRETYIIWWGVGRDGPEAHSERRRRIHGTVESYPVREGDAIYVREMIMQIGKQRSEALSTK